jgi:hypothetical protein
MNLKENWLRLIRNDGTALIGKPWEAFKGNFFDNIFISDPVSAAISSRRVLDKPYLDSWGVTWVLHTGDPGATPYITAENKVVKDLSGWKDAVTFPALDGHDWKPFEDFVASVDRDRYLIMSFVPGGLFERTHYLMGFEGALCAYMDEPDLMYQLVGALADWKIGQLQRILQHLKPDVIHFHDDWGDKSNVFLPPALWRQIIKPHHRRIVDCVKAGGALFMHHSDSICGPLVEDMAEIGIDIWQGAIPQDDIPAIQEKLGGRMAIIGGIDAQIIDLPVADEAVIRAEIRRCIDSYCPRGAFIPCIPNVVPIFPEVKQIYEDELVRYGKVFQARGSFRQQ